MAHRERDFPEQDFPRAFAKERQEILDRSGVGYCIMQILFDAQGAPSDYRFLDVNSAFERHTGLVSPVGRTARELVPDLEYSWIERYARVATTGQRESFVQGSEAMGRWFDVDAFRVGDPANHRVALLFTEISTRIRAEEDVKKLLAEKELLLRETHHRIKNNMSLVQGFLSLRVEESTDATSRGLMQDAIGRLRSMMLLYDKLYQSDTYREASLGEFLPRLVEEIVGVFSRGDTVETNIDVDDITLSDEQLSAIGILVNELISNSTKYAFDGIDAPCISVSARQNGDTVTVVYADNGIGIPDSVTSPDTAETDTGFGMQLIRALAEQLRATTTIEGEAGTRFVFTFDV